MLKIAPLGLAVIFFTACGNDPKSRDEKRHPNAASWPLIETLETNAASPHRGEGAILTVTQSDKENRVKKVTKQVEWIIAPEVWRRTKPSKQR
ncbi:hypothetical protein [Sulfurovum sp.]|uniref:hypothetical protein n=1 Tax=Sulfurovum sp. TaxID=1969726 RepID=UPI002A36346C|nr:hypothetical protein [Sulfurovum sp.]MDD2450399.1 hypothetical protein [Sulfurovum sp.]MDD3498843.1 hypothetical protein [Sulfurovum sp.]MDY0403304.1 hypothetical protein [Sulfurovum sp.]